MKDVLKFATKLFVGTVAIFAGGKLVKNSMNDASRIGSSITKKGCDYANGILQSKMPFLRARVHRDGWRLHSICAGAMPEVRLGCSQD